MEFSQPGVFDPAVFVCTPGKSKKTLEISALLWFNTNLYAGELR